MNFNRKPTKPEPVRDPVRPTEVRVGGEQLDAWCKRQAAGEVTIWAMDVLGPGTGNGGRNGEYVLHLRWPPPKEETLF